MPRACSSDDFQVFQNAMFLELIRGLPFHKGSALNLLEAKSAPRHPAGCLWLLQSMDVSKLT